MFSLNDEVKANEVGPGTSRKIMTYSDNLMLCELKLEKGAVGPVHSHPHEQIGYIVSGSLEVTVDGETRILKAGDTYQTGPNVPHGAVALEDSILLDIFNPKREDFL